MVNLLVTRQGPGVYNHEVLPVMSPVMQVTSFRQGKCTGVCAHDVPPEMSLVDPAVSFGTWETVSRAYRTTTSSTRWQGVACRLFLQCLNRFQTDFPLVAVAKLLLLLPVGDVITRETVSRSGMTTTSSLGATSRDVPRGPVKLVGELAVNTTTEPVT